MPLLGNSVVSNLLRFKFMALFACLLLVQQYMLFFYTCVMRIPTQ